ncbi:2-phosphosulfolactate phosphatase [Pullulanibacillus sp. KACC 23026]|uniref:2-phosphosulfolactate phosphatase n=1 Tax=Pullulanibacillus sp. KACC 23026 TaxID=3028315 RepID=UPI0023AF13D0|nr:2-phosphosulfolactate phosphatase [Pullulanibacillus sp. KACC 23026]WEG12115.1 2-phosphosulfolactate phosphatase [Pullulanibacillus sp. KACC 23026]
MAPLSNVVVIIDVLSFTTCVEIACSREALVFPYRYKDKSADRFANSVNALLAKERGQIPSLSPNSLLELTPKSRIVLPSPNGSTCTVIARESNVCTIAGCLRNAFAVSNYIKMNYPSKVVSVVACGEQWSNGTLRPAIEDWIGVGAILSQFEQSTLSSEAKVAVSAFRHAEHDLRDVLMSCSTGRELTEKGFPEDVSVASDHLIRSIIFVFKSLNLHKF